MVDAFWDWGCDVFWRCWELTEWGYIFHLRSSRVDTHRVMCGVSGVLGNLFRYL